MSNNTIFYINIEDTTLNNEYYRKVLYTTKKQQLVVMSLKPGEDIPKEIHKDHDQFIRIESGEGVALIGEAGSTKYKLTDGISIIIPAGTYHQIINTSKTDKLKLYTIYSPPEHDSNRIDIRKPYAKQKYLKYKEKYITLKNNLLNNITNN